MDNDNLLGEEGKKEIEKHLNKFSAIMSEKSKQAATPEPSQNLSSKEALSTISINIPESLKMKLKIKAIHDKKNITDIIIKLVRQYVGEE